MKSFTIAEFKFPVDNTYELFLHKASLHPCLFVIHSQFLFRSAEFGVRSIKCRINNSLPDFIDGRGCRQPNSAVLLSLSQSPPSDVSWTAPLALPYVPSIS